MSLRPLLRSLLLVTSLPACSGGAGGTSGTAGTGGEAGAGGAGVGGGDTCAQASDFLDVTGSSAGAAFPAPSLSVSCTADEVVVDSNGIPSFGFDQVTPNALKAQDFAFHFPRAPVLAANTSAVPLGGAVAVAVNGLPIFGPTEAPMDGYRDPLLDGLLDFCNGHTAPGGVYHFHARPECLFTDLEGNTSLVVAYAFDGFPVLAPFACSEETCAATVELASSWQPAAGQWDASGNPLYLGTAEGSWDVVEHVPGSGDLDECNGRELPGGGYAYYATDTFPYFIGCYRGTPTQNAIGGMGPPL